MSSPSSKLTEGPVGTHLVAMTVPVLLGIITMMGQALIDAWFIGRVGDLASITLGALGARVADRLGFAGVRIAGDPERAVGRAAVVPGSGFTVR